MIWSFIFLLIIAIIVPIFNLPFAVLIIAYILFVVATIYFSFYPILFEKEVKKILQFLKKSRQPYNRFLYFLYIGDEKEAENLLNRIRYKEVKNISQIILLSKQKKFDKAKELLPLMKESKNKWYYTAALALEEGDLATYQTNKDLIKDELLLTWLNIENKRKQGEETEALHMLDKVIPTLRGLKLLSALQYKKEITSA
ncbi:hypothetical protein [Niallia sp. 03133]|uniref:hypothetical protein n=1 Tax=Niallia sp. 03133 TaxID=3458060 RepID=UPI004044687F